MQRLSGGVLMRGVHFASLGHSIAAVPSLTRMTSTAPQSQTRWLSASIYNTPQLYDLAFSYRDFPKEVDFLLQAHRRHSSLKLGCGSTVRGRSPRTALELGAGPASHSIEAASRNQIAASALDCNAAMAAYGEQAAARAEVPLQYVQGDMSSFDWEELTGRQPQFDTVWCLLGTGAHLLTAEAWVGMFSSVAASLVDGGTFVVELPHPKETFRVGTVTADGWSVEAPNGTITISWGREDDHFDPITQVRQATVEFTFEHSESVGRGTKSKAKKGRKKGRKQSGSGVQLSQHMTETVSFRELGLQELMCLAALSGSFEAYPAVYGDLDIDVQLGDNDAIRLVAVFTKQTSDNFSNKRGCM